MHTDVRSTNFLPRRREVFLSLFNSSLRIVYTTHFIHLNAAAINNITDQTSTRKRRVFRHAILGFNARSVHRPARSHRPLRRHAKKPGYNTGRLSVYSRKSGFPRKRTWNSVARWTRKTPIRSESLGISRSPSPDIKYINTTNFHPSKTVTKQLKML